MVRTNQSVRMCAYGKVNGVDVWSKKVWLEHCEHRRWLKQCQMLKHCQSVSLPRFRPSTLAQRDINRDSIKSSKCVNKRYL